MEDRRSQSHVKWDCKHHVVIVPKYRSREFYGSLRSEIGGILRQLCQQREIELLERTAMADHVHLLLSVAPKFSIANTAGFLKGKSASRISQKQRELYTVERSGHADIVLAPWVWMKQ